MNPYRAPLSAPDGGRTHKPGRRFWRLGVLLLIASIPITVVGAAIVIRPLATNSPQESAFFGRRRQRLGVPVASFGLFLGVAGTALLLSVGDKRGN